MPKITIEDKYNNQIISLERDVSALPEVVEMMEDLLKGLGYCFEGRLDIIEEDK